MLLSDTAIDMSQNQTECSATPLTIVIPPLLSKLISPRKTVFKSFLTLALPALHSAKGKICPMHTE